MAKHLIVMSVIMEDMDGSPEESAAVLMGDALGPDEHPLDILNDYWQAGLVEITAEVWEE